MASHASESPPGFSIDKVRLPLAGLGVVALFAGMATGLIGGVPDITPRILYAVGVLLIGIYVALDPEDVWAKLTGRGVLYSGNAVLIAVAALVILGLINVAASRYPQKLDLTASKQYTLSDQSIKVAQALPEPIKVTAFPSGVTSARRTSRSCWMTTRLDRAAS
jgi:ABC-type uncharacterized transport system involved in gliding motility auxiliary subunit